MGTPPRLALRARRSIESSPDRQLCLGRGAATPSHQVLEPGVQLGECEGLGQIVVAAGPEASDPFVELSQRREDENRRLHRGGPQRLDDRNAVQAGEHPIDDNGVEVGFRRHVERVAPVGRLFDRKAFRTEALGQEFRRGGVILDDEHPSRHRISPASPRRTKPSPGRFPSLNILFLARLRDGEMTGSPQAEFLTRCKKAARARSETAARKPRSKACATPPAR